MSDQDNLGNRLRFRCATCGGWGVERRAGDLGRGRKFCSRACYDDRNGASATMNILRFLGGPRFVAEVISVPYRQVRGWRSDGIPSIHHGAIIELAKTLQKRGITPDSLVEATRQHK